MKRYHIKLADKRTTVSLHPVLSQLLAFKLQQQPDTPQAHKAVRQWLQETTERATDHQTGRLSQWLQGQAVLHISDTKLSKAWANRIADE